MIEWVSALVDVGTQEMAHGDQLEFARDRREVVVEGRAVELTPSKHRFWPSWDRPCAGCGAAGRSYRAYLATSLCRSNVVDTVVRTLRKKLGS